MSKVAYRVLSPLKRDGKRIPVGGQALFDSDDEEQDVLAALGVIDGRSGVFVEEGPAGEAQTPPPVVKPRSGKPAKGEGS
jgi:hypothetical protein